MKAKFLGFREDGWRWFFAYTLDESLTAEQATERGLFREYLWSKHPPEGMAEEDFRASCEREGLLLAQGEADSLGGG